MSYTLRLMKTFKNTDIVALILGSFFLLYYCYKFLFSGFVYEENDLPSLIISFVSICTSAYVFMAYKKILNVQFENKITNNHLTWVIRFEVTIAILSLYVIYSMLILDNNEEIDLFAEEGLSFVVKSFFDGFMKYVVLTIVTIFLAVKYILFGSELKKIEDDKYLFLITGIIIMIYGLMTLMNIFFVLEDNYVTPIIKSISIILVGVSLKKYSNRKVLVTNKQNIEEQEGQYKDLVTLIEKEVRFVDATKRVKEDLEAKAKLAKEDPSRFMPK